jgi:hypothetical protein
LDNVVMAERPKLRAGLAFSKTVYMFRALVLALIVDDKYGVLLAGAMFASPDFVAD